MVDRSPGFFDLQDRLAELSARGDDLERVKALVDFEIFRPALEAVEGRQAGVRLLRPDVQGPHSSESVRKHHLGLHSFRSMRRMDASFKKASAL